MGRQRSPGRREIRLPGVGEAVSSARLAGRDCLPLFDDRAISRGGLPDRVPHLAMIHRRGLHRAEGELGDSLHIAQAERVRDGDRRGHPPGVRPQRRRSSDADRLGDLAGQFLHVGREQGLGPADSPPRMVARRSDLLQVLLQVRQAATRAPGTRARSRTRVEQRNRRLDPAGIEAASRPMTWKGVTPAGSIGVFMTAAWRFRRSIAACRASICSSSR